VPSGVDAGCVGEFDPITSVAAAREIVDALAERTARLEVTRFLFLTLR